MRLLIQRVSEASVIVDNQCVGNISGGLLAFLGVEKNDTEVIATKLLKKMLGYRVFADPQGKMNLNVQQVEGEVLVVPQFTLAANTNKGLRPSFSDAGPPVHAEAMYNYFLQQAIVMHHKVAAGIFAADMKVQLINDGPVTFVLDAY